MCPNAIRTKVSDNNRELKKASESLRIKPAQQPNNTVRVWVCTLVWKSAEVDKEIKNCTLNCTSEDTVSELSELSVLWKWQQNFWLHAKAVGKKRGAGKRSRSDRMRKMSCFWMGWLSWLYCFQWRHCCQLTTLPIIPCVMRRLFAPTHTHSTRTREKRYFHLLYMIRLWCVIKCAQQHTLEL